MKKSLLGSAVIAAAMLGSGMAPPGTAGNAPPEIVKAAQGQQRNTRRTTAGLDDDLLSRMVFSGGWGPSFPISRPPTGALRIRRAAQKRRNKAQHRRNCRR